MKLLGRRWTILQNSKPLKTVHCIEAEAEWMVRLSAAKDPGTWYEAVPVMGGDRIQRYEPHQN
ncbi:hypothetical protein LCGC14_0583190 [marine sediment metagenome]|uniref:Uncharacterized protein n=1 Tax=marine sediment metagenome TaxID=412755 RepID=A0A0F9RKQ3_9ZZZZ